MNTPHIAQSYLVHTALEEAGDMVVVDGQGNSTPYSLFKEQTHGIRLTFPSHPIARQNREFQVWSFKRHENGLIIWRSTIAGGAATSDMPSGDRYRPLPVFEVFDLHGQLGPELKSPEFLAFIRTLDFGYYPEPVRCSGMGYVEKPAWFVPEEMTYEHVPNKKRKSSRTIRSVTNWAKEVRDAFQKMLWYALREKSCTTGLSVCFAAEEFRRYDTCTYFCEHKFDLAVLAYQFGEFR